MQRALCLLALGLALLLPSPTPAETRSDVYNGATCIPYPPFDSSNAVPYSHWLYGFRQSAFCHFVIPDDWRVDDISYVLFHGLVNPGDGPMRVRLCVYGAIGLARSCGTERTLPDSGNFSTNWVALPGDMPSSPIGAYLSVRFPNRISVVAYFVPVFNR